MSGRRPIGKIEARGALQVSCPHVSAEEISNFKGSVVVLVNKGDRRNARAILHTCGKIECFKSTMDSATKMLPFGDYEMLNLDEDHWFTKI